MTMFSIYSMTRTISWSITTISLRPSSITIIITSLNHNLWSQDHLYTNIHEIIFILIQTIDHLFDTSTKKSKRRTYEGGTHPHGIKDKRFKLPQCQEWGFFVKKNLNIRILFSKPMRLLLKEVTLVTF